MLTLGLDPSLRAYGWAVYDSKAANPKNRRVSSGHEGTLSLTVPVARFMHFRALVEDLLSRYSVQTVGIESPAYQGGPFSENHFGLMMFSLEAVFEKRIDCVLFDPTTLKFMSTGKSNAGKLDMQRFVQMDTLDPNPIQNDEADAFCVARAAARFMELKDNILSADDLSLNEKKVFLTRIRKKKTATGARIIKRTAHIFRENSRYFSFSKVPAGDVTLPSKSMINSELLNWLESEGNNG
jgi:Holliday junction resolvasome RuvABC endonuclease subunit